MIKNWKFTGVAGIIGVLCVIFLCVSCDSLYSERMQKLKEKQPSAGDIAAAFKSTHSAILLKTVNNVAVDDESAVDAALTAYNDLSAEVKALLGTEKSLLDSLKTKIDTLNAATAAAFKVTHSTILLKDVNDVTVDDESAVDAALTAYNDLSAGVKALLSAEKRLLDIQKDMITLGIPLVAVPGGMVGTSHTWSSTNNYPNNSKPVTVQSFKISATETTYELWYEVRQWALNNGYTFANTGREGYNGASGGVPPTERKFEPVTYVSWRDAVVWCNALSERMGKTAVYKTAGGLVIRSSTGSIENEIVAPPSGTGYRLPTEAEWEYAARGGVPATGTPWTYQYSGSNDAIGVAWYSGNSDWSTHEVGDRAPNSLGLYDMSGNVWEWCWDKYSSEYSLRVLRGGDWYNDTSYAAVSYRGDFDPGNTDGNVGFRFVCPPGSE
ncbi:hypothetical protein FACS1894151_06260 [Spirochaetia bacterium]|nr:hypothetical protein FACS1894151_06260 [Spirochaetia bacterium]